MALSLHSRDTEAANLSRLRPFLPLLVVTLTGGFDFQHGISYQRL